MDVELESDWVAVRPSDLACGDLFATGMRGMDVLALMADDGGGLVVLVLARRGGDAGRDSHPAPVVRNLSVIEGTVLKFSGSAVARPLFERETPYGPSFPTIRTDPSHGALIVGADRTPWIHVQEQRGATRTVELTLNLRTGQAGDPGSGAVHAAWDLVAVQNGGIGSTLARFDLA